jgi:hypothetical protein
MRQRNIKALLVIVSLLFGFNLSAFAQSAQKATPQITSDTDQPSNTVSDEDIAMLRSDLRAKRKQITAENMTLTSDEATKFWPIYDAYRQEAKLAADKRWALIKEYAANYNNMTDAQAADYMSRSTAIEQAAIALRQKYVPVFEKVVSPKKTALWFQIDRRVDLLINLQLSSTIPMVDTSKQN